MISFNAIIEHINWLGPKDDQTTVFVSLMILMMEEGSGKAYLLSTSNSRWSCYLQRRIGNVPRVAVANTTEMSLQWTLLNENV